MKKLQYTTNDPSATTDYLAGDNTWKTIPGGGGGSPLTTKGDLFTHDASTDARLPVGLDTQVLLADSTTATGLKWGNNTTPTPLGYYGAFYDATNQIATSSGGYPNPNQNNSAPMAMKFGQTDFSNGVSIQSQSQITIANTGIYNIQFSAQLYNTGGDTEKVWIWLRKNGVDLNDSNGFLPIGASTNNEQNIASWNFLVDAIGGDYFQIMWASSQWNRVELYYQPASSNPPKPEIPSIILTVTQQSGIMAGTGITALNGLTADVQTLATGTTGTDFAISSVGTSHTFNVPTASATNRGLLSSADWSTFNNKQNAITLTTTGTSGAATLVGSTLNVPQYASIGSGSSILQVTFGGGTLTAGLVTYANFSSTAGALTEATRRLPMPTACTLSNFYFLMSTNQPASGSLVLTMRKNGADTSLIITVAAGSAAGTYSNTVNNATFVAGDLMSIRFNNNATGASGGIGAFSCLMTI